ncbi:anti-anti-sigma factor [Streptomyces sp. Ru73]|uniref:STAS domain-containing protein n=1 Tax=Streptomyces sp. Ru73 TaxID=2080748 RepID=UPI000CDE3080|nr:STAS domain-containing protein [Streptomyces sp. Ru73]POX42832.1 anti-anti-sigma factor [Streptomyces sp. Ru73]
MGTPEVPFGLQHYTVDGSVVLQFSGELDIWANTVLSPHVVRQLDRPCPRVIVDLRPTTFLDAGGLRLLVRIHKQVTAAGGTLRVVLGRPRVRRVIRLARLERVFTVLDGFPASLAAPGEDDGSGPAPPEQPSAVRPG